MPKYLVKVTCYNAAIRTTYEVDADSAEEAEQIISDGECECVDEEIVDAGQVHDVEVEEDEDAEESRRKEEA